MSGQKKNHIYQYFNILDVNDLSESSWKFLVTLYFIVWYVIRLYKILYGMTKHDTQFSIIHKLYKMSPLYAYCYMHLEFAHF